ncbi:hypothetical protein, partial [Bradyrhizobium sp. 25ACV]
VGGLSAARRLLRAVNEARVWQAAVSAKVLDTHRQLHEHLLADVIHHARVLGWDVEADDDGVEFTSPDGGVATFDQDETSPYAVAEELHDT